MPYKLVPPKAGRWSHWRVRGTENGIYVDRSTKTGDRRLAQRILGEWKTEAQKQSATGRKKAPTFAEAAIAYMEAGGERRFLAPLLRHFGNTPVLAIGQSEIDAAAATLYPTATSATRNRQVYSPMSAILKRAGLPAAFWRPKGAQGTPRLVWLKPEEAMRLLDAAEAVDARFGALCTFLLYTGCRLSEALRLKWDDVNLEENFAYVGRTKNGEPRPVHLPDGVVASLADLALVSKGRSVVFGLSKCGRTYDLLERVANAAGVNIPSGVAFHLFRHTYGAWMRRYSGLDTTGLVATGAWKSRQAAAVYEHAVTTDEARKSDLLPTRAGIVRNDRDA
jgi:integrase